MQTNTETITGWHFLAEPKLSNRDGRAIVPGEWIEVDGEIEPCMRGLHISIRATDALNYAPVRTRYVQRCELGGIIVPHGNDKHAGSKRRCLWIADCTKTLHEFACLCAEDALAHVAHSDPRSVAAIAAKRDWLAGRIDDARLAAARVAAWDAAWDSAWGAVRAAAWAAQNARLERMLMELAP